MIVTVVPMMLAVLLTLTAKLFASISGGQRLSWRWALAFAVLVLLGSWLNLNMLFNSSVAKLGQAAMLVAVSAAAGALVLGRPRRAGGAALGVASGLFGIVGPYFALNWLLDVLLGGRIG